MPPTLGFFLAFYILTVPTVRLRRGEACGFFTLTFHRRWVGMAGGGRASPILALGPIEPKAGPAFQKL